MKFSAQQDVVAPIDLVFAAITEVEIYERAAMRRGADVVRKDALKGANLGACWDAKFMMRGKLRTLFVEVTTFKPPSELVLSLQSESIKGAARLELFALTKSRTRMTVDTKCMHLLCRRGSF